MIDLNGKRALVCGGSKGIGREICLEFARCGADVAFSYLKSRESAVKTAEAITKMGRKALPLQAELSDPEQAEQLVQNAAAFLNGLDILVHTAGIFVSQGVETISDADWQRVMAVNVDSAFYACRASIPFLKQSGNSGRIILFSSQAALNGTAHALHYGTSKAAILGMTYSLAKELGPLGVTVNAVVPGRLETDMLGYADEARRKEWLKQTPLGYIGEARDAAGLTAFLASDQARYITGAKINVNGGLLMG